MKLEATIEVIKLNYIDVITTSGEDPDQGEWD